MLVLSRKQDEAIMIGATVRMVVASIQEALVGLRFHHPDEMPVYKSNESEKPPRYWPREPFTEHTSEPKEQTEKLLVKGESVWLGIDVKVILVQIGDDKVRLGIEHPREVEIFREE